MESAATLRSNHLNLGSHPQSWTLAAIGDLAIKVGSGKTPNGGNLRYRAHGRPFVRSQNIGWGELLLNDLQYIDEETHAEFSASEIEIDDVLLNITGASIGRSAVASPALVGGNVNQHVCIIRTKAVDARLVNQLMQSPIGQRQIESFQAGGNRQGLNFSQVASIVVPLPPTRTEQRAIADALSGADALVDALEQLLNKKRHIKQGARQDLLSGRRRLPGFTGRWSVTELRNLGQIIRGVAYKPETDLSDSDNDQTVRLLRSNNVQSDQIVFSEIQFVNRYRVREDQFLCNGDLLICMANGSKQLVGKAGQFESFDEHRYTFGAFMACYRPNSNVISPEFVAYLFQTQAFRDHVDLLLAGSSINNLRPEGVLGFAAPIPPTRAEQDAIAYLLSDLDTELTALEARLTKARALKQAMAQALLTGRIRLVEGTAA
jgi:type I restriction enzyme S subunit